MSIWWLVGTVTALGVWLAVLLAVADWLLNRYGGRLERWAQRR